MIELTNLDSPSATEINTVKVDQVLVETDGFIEAHLLRVLPFPLTGDHTSILNALKPIAIDIARYRLESKGEVREDVRRRFEDALSWLDKVAKGEIILWTEDNGISSDDGNTVNINKNGVAFRSNSRRFTERQTNDYTRPWYRNF